MFNGTIYFLKNGPDLRFQRLHIFIHPNLTFPGDSLLKPGDVFFREGPEEMTLEVLLRVFLQTKGGSKESLMNKN